MRYGRFHWTVLGAALGSVLLVELARRLVDARLWWVWPVVLVAGVLVFTRVVFAKITALNLAAQSHELRAERLFTSAAVGMVLVSGGCKVLRMNPAAERLTGWQSAELEGHSFCSDLFAPGADGKPICFEACLRVPASASAEPLTTMTLQTKSGRRLAVAVCITTLQDNEFYLFFWDISERTRLERELAKRRRQAESLYQVGREMVAMVDLDRNLERLLAKAREVMEADFAGWATLHETSPELHWQVAVGASSTFSRTPLALGDTVVGRVLAAGRPYVTQNLHTDLLSSEAAAAVEAEHFKAAMAVPLQVRDRQYGVLFVAHRQPARMSDEDLLLLSNLGSHMAIAVENNDLLRRMQQVAALEERQRLARDMHDSFGQILTFVGMRLHLLGGMARAHQATDMVSEIDDLHATLKEAHQDVRRSIYQLKESGPALASLWDRWTETMRQFQEQTGIQVEMTGHESMPAHLPDEVESQVTRVIQEALANIRNHSGASNAWVKAYRDGANLVIAVQDNGCGFETGTVVGPGEYHFGLHIMRERIESVGGNLVIASDIGLGTEVRLTVPAVEGGSYDHVTAQSPARR
ncbi:MAG TPA: GAF domain-containing protein [Symbiobacteriaceae bacterium]|nr:GAF domain-containing protein [Symbiobacteriaceae bacterium]